MKQKLFSINKISIILVVFSIVFFLSSFNYSYSIQNNNNEIKDDEFDYIFDPGEYIEDENKKQEKNINTNKINNQDNLAQHSDKSSKIINTKEDINLVNKSHTKNSINPTYEDQNNDFNINDKDKIVVKARINVANIEKIGFLNIAGFINGQEVLKNVTLDKFDPSKQTLNVNLPVDKETDIIKAGDRDEFFVCAYHIKDLLKEYNSMPYFDCDEGDLLGPDTATPTISRLFSPNSLVYLDSQNVFNNSSNKYTQLLSTNNDNRNENNQQQTEKNEEQVKIKIYVPLEDRKDTQKLKIAVMIKGEIKSAIINNVQDELNKLGGYTISREFTFDRDTNIGKIQIGDRYHACVTSTDLNPPEGSECEKRILKNFGRENVLYVR
ncbi:MAG TPA: hypothetical protein VIQ04_06765 [Nitrososphaeraceae archaeon]